MKKFILSFFGILPLFLFSQNTRPQISNLKATYDQNLYRITVSYDVSDAEDDSVEVILKISDDRGVSYGVDVSQAQGDVGYPVATGTDKKIIWDALGSIVWVIYEVKLIVDDQYEIPIQSLVDQVDSVRLRQDLSWIARNRHFQTHPLVNEEIKDSLHTCFQQLGLETRRQGNSFRGYSVENIIGRQTGILDDSTTYIVDAHFDAVENVNGADDNASGITGVMEAARILSQYEFRNSINFIGFDLEEEGLIGSIQYVSRGGIRIFEKIAGVINFDMIAYYDTAANSQSVPLGFNLLYPNQFNQLQADSFRGNFINSIAGENQDELRQAFDSAAVKYVPELKVISVNAPPSVVAPDFWRSDHAPFWTRGIPALLITDGGEFRNPNYHTQGDSLETVDLEFMTQVVKATVGTLADLAGIMHSSEDTTKLTVFNTGLADLSRRCELQFSTLEDAYVLSLTDPACLKGPSRISVFDINGREVHHKYFPHMQQHFSVSVADLIPGMYIFDFKNESGRFFRKIIVN